MKIAGKLLTEFSDSDVLFLVETVDPRLVTKIDTLKGDPTIIEGMLGQEAAQLCFRELPSVQETKIVPFAILKLGKP